MYVHDQLKGPLQRWQISNLQVIIECVTQLKGQIKKWQFGGNGGDITGSSMGQGVSNMQEETEAEAKTTSMEEDYSILDESEGDQDEMLTTAKETANKSSESVSALVNNFLKNWNFILVKWPKGKHIFFQLSKTVLKIETLFKPATLKGTLKPNSTRKVQP